MNAVTTTVSLILELIAREHLLLKNKLFLLIQYKKEKEKLIRFAKCSLVLHNIFPESVFTLSSLCPSPGTQIQRCISAKGGGRGGHC